MFNIKKCEKEIAFSFLKREIGLKEYTLEQASKKLEIHIDILKQVIDTEGKYYSTTTLFFWSECIARKCSADEMLDSILERKKAPQPIDRFYNDIWQFIVSVEAEKLREIAEIQKNQ